MLDFSCRFLPSAEFSEIHFITLFSRVSTTQPCSEGYYLRLLYLRLYSLNVQRKFISFYPFLCIWPCTVDSIGGHFGTLSMGCLEMIQDRAQELFVSRVFCTRQYSSPLHRHGHLDVTMAPTATKSLLFQLHKLTLLYSVQYRYRLIVKSVKNRPPKTGNQLVLLGVIKKFLSLLPQNERTLDAITRCKIEKNLKNTRVVTVNSVDAGQSTPLTVWERKDLKVTNILRRRFYCDDSLSKVDNSAIDKTFASLSTPTAPSELPTRVPAHDDGANREKLTSLLTLKLHSASHFLNLRPADALSANSCFFQRGSCWYCCDPAL